MLAGMGCIDSFAIANCVLPISDGVECIDVAFAPDSVLADFKAKRAVFASEKPARHHVSSRLGR